MSGWIIRSDERPSREEAGGKGDGLLRLQALGLRVPPFVVLTAAAYRATCHPEVPEHVPPDVDAALDVAWAELGGTAPLAVRSSGVDEDSAERSFAGQMETVLGVTDRAALSAAVLRCWRSLRSARAEAYRAASGAATDRLAMAVVIQRLVTPEVSGVLFTVNPAAGRADEFLMSAVWGLGEGLVSGALDADTFVLDRTGGVRQRRLAEKTHRLVPSPSGPRREDVPAALRAAPTLDDATLRDLAALALRAEAAAGRPLDIEFCVAGGTTWFLQARPVTAFVPRARPGDGHRQVWDNANIVESYAGVTLPLTFSFIRATYHAVYWQFCQVLGLREDEIRAQDGVIANMLGLVRGRVFYNLLNWYSLCSLLPGFRFNKGFMEGMMGLRTPDALDEPAASAAQKYLVELPRLLRVGLRAVWLQTTLEGRIAEFHRDFEAVHARFVATDFDALPPHECLRCYADLERDVLWRWKAPIINDFSAMIFYGLLRKLTVAWNVDPGGGLQNALVSGQGRIESTRVSESLVEIARRMVGDPTFAAAFAAAPPDEALRLLRGHVVAGPLFARYLEEFGDRCVAELKLESVPMRDDPALCVAMLQGHVRRGAASAAPQSTLRTDATAVALARLGWRPSGIVVPRRWVYLWVLRHARAAIRNRENQRLARTRAYGLARRIFRSIGASFAQSGVLERPDDVFYLEVEEIRGFVRGTTTLTDLRSLVRARRAEFDAWRRMPPPPDHFVTYGAVHEGNAFEADAAPAAAAGSGATTLTGLGACPGIVEALAVVLFDPDASAPIEGCVLVTYQTDPGWVVLFPSIRGLAVERGSMLSHSAIVAREMGIPAVVGVRDLVRTIRTGDRVRLDGAKGTIEILARAANP